MKLLYALPFVFSLNVYAQTSQINDNVNWQSISSTPEVNSQVIVQDFIPVDDTNNESSFIQDELTNFDFLTESIDDRVFYTFDAKISVLDKYTDDVKEYDIKEAEPAIIGKFVVDIKSCANIPINNVENQLAYLQVLKNNEVVFKGWMSNINKNFNFPELAELYINVLSCTKADRPITPIVTTDEVESNQSATTDITTEESLETTN